MTARDELLKNGWDTFWVEEDEPRELLSKSFHLNGLIESAEVGIVIAKFAAKYHLEQDVNLSVSDWVTVVFLNAYNPGSLNDSFYALATDIQHYLDEHILLERNR